MKKRGGGGDFWGEEGGKESLGFLPTSPPSDELTCTVAAGQPLETHAGSCCVSPKADQETDLK